MSGREQQGREASGEGDVEMVAEVDLVPLAELEPYAHNPKSHPDEQVGKIADSIQQYGFDQPIVVAGDGEIVKGHGRYAASQSLGLETVPVIWRDGMGPDEVRAARIADNKTNLDSGFDYDLLAMEVDELLASNDRDDIVDLIGFRGPDVDDLIERDGGSIDDLVTGAEWASDPEQEADEGDDSEGDGDDPEPGDVETRTLYDADGNEVEVQATTTVDENGDTETVHSTGGGEDYDGPYIPPGEFECPECNHTFEASMEDMGPKGEPPDDEDHAGDGSNDGQDMDSDE